MESFLINFKIPQTVATVTTAGDLAFLKKTNAEEKTAIADIFEFRLDNFATAHQLDQVEKLLQQFDAPVLITPRHPAEGGVFEPFSDENIRIEAIRRFMPFATLIDIEIEQFTSISSRVDFTCPIVGSNHDFEKAIPTTTLKERITFCRENSIKIAKFAMVLKNTAELAPLIEVVSSTTESGQLISAMGMGPQGRESRFILANAGSCLNYGYLQHENAPGQWPAQELKQALRSHLTSQ